MSSICCRECLVAEKIKIHTYSHKIMSHLRGDSVSSASTHDAPFLGPRDPMAIELQQVTGSGGNDAGNGSSLVHQVIELPRPTSFPFVLSFSKLTYSVKLRRNITLPGCFRMKSQHESQETMANTKVLLNDVSGEAREGEIMGVLGASGSGKSTLIDALANRIAGQSLKGTVTLNGEFWEPTLLKAISAYVMQEDLLFPMLTVEETLLFAAEFRLPRTLPAAKKKARVQALIDQLGLRSAAQTVIGDEGHRGVSGGERRRVSIGADIIHDPVVLFLDEPTSGLDSTSAFMVVKVLQRIAHSGSIVFMSIHQPSNRILNLIDRLIFLSRGEAVFNGSPASLPAFFSEFGRPILANESWTEFAFDLIQELEASSGGIKTLVDFNNSWRIKQTNFQIESADLELSLKDAIKSRISRGMLVSDQTIATFANPNWIEVLVLARRSMINSIRTPEVLGIRLGAIVVTGFILATIFWQLDNSPKGVQERIGFFSFAMTSTFYSCSEALPVFLMERYIFMRETAYNAYRRSSYVLSHSITSIPSILFLSLTFAVITFWPVGLSGGFSGFLFFFSLLVASFWAGNSFVTFLSAIVSHVMIGYTVVVAILAYFLLFSGFFINRNRMPPYWIWFHYSSLVKYPYEGALQNELEDSAKCFVRGVQIFDNSPMAGVPAPVKLKLLKSMSGVLGLEISSSTCFTTGTDILKNQGVTDLSRWSCLWITVGLGFLFRILFYFALLFGSKNKRR